MSEEKKEVKKTRYINPYLGGVLLGLVLIAANFVSGRGLGASGAAKSAVVASVNTIAPAHTEKALFFKEYNQSHPDGPMKSWLVFQMLGVIVGAFISGALAGRLKFKVEHSPKITSPEKTDLCAHRGNPFWFRIPVGKGLHQWLGPERHGGAFPGRLHFHGLHIRNRFCPGLLFQEKLDLTL